MSKVLVAASRFADAPGRVPDEESFENLFRCYSRRLWGFFRQRGLSPEECNDLTQETFLQVHRSLAAFEGRSSFETWLFHLAANVYRKELRRRGAQKRQGSEITWDRPGDPDPALCVWRDPGRELLGKERLRTLRRAMSELPTQLRRYLLLRVYQELSYAEIAVVMKVSIKTVKVQLFRARRKLAGILSGELDER